jgi:hypothetical protein
VKPFFNKPVLEKEVERDGSDYALSRGWLEYKITSPSVRGFPDRFYARRGRIVLAEWKRGDEQPTDQQLKRHKELRDAGVEVVVLRSVDQAQRLFR